MYGTRPRALENASVRLAVHKEHGKSKSVGRPHNQPFLVLSCEMASKETSSDEEALRKMKDKWIGLLHHVCNDHDWPGGSCDHGELPEDHSLPWFDRRAKDFEALQKIILDPALLESFKSITLNSDTLVLWSVLIACLLCTHLRKCHSRKRFT